MEQHSVLAAGVHVVDGQAEYEVKVLAGGGLHWRPEASLTAKHQPVFPHGKQHVILAPCGKQLLLRGNGKRLVAFCGRGGILGGAVGPEITGGQITTTGQTVTGHFRQIISVLTILKKIGRRIRAGTSVRIAIGGSACIHKCYHAKEHNPVHLILPYSETKVDWIWLQLLQVR